MRTALLVLALLLAGGYKLYNPPAHQPPLTLTLARTVGMTPFSLQAKVRAATEGREVCLVVEGPESQLSCRVLDGVTWWATYTLRSGGTYTVYATCVGYRTANQQVQVVGVED